MASNELLVYSMFSLAGSMEALYDYTASAEDEISLKSGAIVDDVLIIDEGWAEGTLQGKRGLFPKNYCRDVPADPANTKTKVGTLWIPC